MSKILRRRKTREDERQQGKGRRVSNKTKGEAIEEAGTNVAANSKKIQKTDSLESIQGQRVPLIN